MLRSGFGGHAVVLRCFGDGVFCPFLFPLDGSWSSFFLEFVFILTELRSFLNGVGAILTTTRLFGLLFFVLLHLHRIVDTPFALHLSKAAVTFRSLFNFSTYLSSWRQVVRLAFLPVVLLLIVVMLVLGHNQIQC